MIWTGTGHIWNAPGAEQHSGRRALLPGSRIIYRYMYIQYEYRYMYIQYEIMLAGFGPERKPFGAILAKIQEFFTFAKKQRAA